MRSLLEVSIQLEIEPKNERFVICEQSLRIEIRRHNSNSVEDDQKWKI